MEFGARSDTGRVRENNEDSHRLAPEISLFVLADGMGGLASGEVASGLAAETIIAHCREAAANPSLALAGKRIEGLSETTNRLASAVRMANRAVYGAARQNGTRQGMGSTVVAVWFEGQHMSIAHVGDSRAYRLRGAELEQLTQDHSFVAEELRQGRMTREQAGNSNLQNVLIRALGIDPEVEVDATEDLVVDGDAVLLCSDGLTRELSDAQIAAVLASAGDAQRAADRLIDLANQAGGGDNITAIVLHQAANPAGVLARMGRLGKLFRHADS